MKAKVYLNNDMSRALKFAREFNNLLHNKKATVGQVEGAELSYKEAMNKLKPKDKLTILNHIIK